MRIWPLSPIAFPSQEKNAKYSAFSLAWGISRERNTNFAPVWSFPLNSGETENSKGTELD